MTIASPFWFLLSLDGVVLAACIGAVWLWRRPSSFGARRFVLASALFYALASFYPLPHAVGGILSREFHRFSRDDVPAGRSVIVLLGSGTITRKDWDEGLIAVMDPIGAERTVEAARIYRLIQPEQVVSSGGVINPARREVSSGHSMRDALVMLGVPGDRIAIEDLSKNTRDEAVIVAEMIAPLRVDHVVVVTSARHMRRSIGTFRAVGINAIPGIARDFEASGVWPLTVPSEAGLRETALVAHELLGLAYYWVRGWYR
jgi:uncharacterized SAM-binding protein YcdF (DUF218 family)